MGARSRHLQLSGFLLAASVLPTLVNAEQRLNLGRVASPEEIAGWYIDVFPDGTNLPKGNGTVVQGKQIYTTACANCHGVNLEGGFGPSLAGGKGASPHRSR